MTPPPVLAALDASVFAAVAVAVMMAAIVAAGCWVWRRDAEQDDLP